MTTSLTAMRAKVGQNLRDEYVTGTFTTSSASVPADTALAEFPNDYFNDWYLVPTAGTYIGVARKVQDFASTGGVITPYTAFAGVTGTVAYELHKFHPTDIRDKINQALQELYPELWVAHIDEWSLITNNILPNSHPVDWTVSTVPDKWNVSGLTASKIAVTSEPTKVRFGPNSMQIIATVGQYIGCRELENKYLHDLAGRTVTLKAWVFDATQRIKVGMYDTDWSYSSIHTGDSKWHLLTLSDTLAADPTWNSLAFAYHCSGGSGTAYLQNMRLIGPTVQRYLLPLAFKELREVWLQTSGNTSFTADSYLAMCDAIHEDISFEKIPQSEWYILNDGTDKWLIFTSTLPYERRLKLVGNKYASTYSSETDTTEFDTPQTNVISAKATALLYRMYANDISSKEAGRFFVLADRWEAEARKLKAQFGIARPSKTLRFSGY